MNQSPSTCLAYCIGCGCHDLHACAGGCHWLVVDYAAAKGVCSECQNHVLRWNAGDRTSNAPDDNLKVIGQALEDFWHRSVKGESARGYVAGMIDTLHWLGELDEQQRIELFKQLGSHPSVPDIPLWINEN
jgi:hypothetical protein